MESRLARKFLYIVAAVITLAIAAGVAYAIWGVEILRWRMVPTAAFRQLPPADAALYRKRAMWIARPDIRNNPARWTPPGHGVPVHGEAAVFFVHPTSFLRSQRWNAPLDDQEANARAAVFLRGQASAFNAMGDVWSPRYRQATFGAFLTNAPEATAALDLAYRDVIRAFDVFLEQAGPSRPLVLAGHSQGAFHLVRLLRERVAGTPLARRLVAAYAVGWPVSRTADLPALGMPACTAPDQAGCLLSWMTFSEPADPSMILDKFDATPGVAGGPRAGTPLVCTNPLTGRDGGSAPASANLGTLIPSEDLRNASLRAGAAPAACTGRGIVSIGRNPPAVGPYVLPGNNYHVYDYSLFWVNVRNDAARRLATWKAR